MDPSINSRSHWKIPYLVEQLDDEDSYIPIIAIIETWLKNYITNAQINIPNYQIFRSDRKDRIRGGSLLLIHDNLPASKVEIFDDDNCEAVICNIDSTNTILASVYRPPNTKDESFKSMINFLQAHINKESELNHKNIIVLGDFNLPCLSWTDAPSPLPNQQVNRNMSECAETLVTFMEKNFLSQYVDKPTRLNNLLDLFLTNDSNMVKQVTVSDTKLSDHRMIKVKSHYGLKPTKSTKPGFTPHTFRSLNFYKADFKQLNDHLSKVDWDELKSICHPTEFPELVRLTVLQICALHAPTKSFKSKSARLSEYRRERRTLSRKKRKLDRRLDNGDLNYDEKLKVKEKLVEIHDKIKNSITDELVKSEQDAINKIKDNPSYFFSWSNRKLKCRSSVGPLLDNNGDLQHDEKIMADLLQKQFCSVFSDPSDPKKSFNNINVNYDRPIEKVTITLEDVDKAIKQIKINSSGGDDDIPALVFRKCNKTLNYPILLIWEESLNTGYICPQFKDQIIAPIHKKGSKALPENYRPICPTSHTIKTCERIVKDKILNHLERNNLLCKHQHGFRPGRSCLTQLLAHINIVLENFLLNKDTDSIYLDYAKAFDKVDHELLIHKLQCYGIQGELLQWIKAFLSNRYQSVAINGVHSYKSKVKSGVPQGTVLGPLLFLIFINDINCCIKHSLISCFADDTRIKKAISSSADVDLLQEDLNNTVQWTSDNNMVLHENKFEYINHSTGDAKLLKQLPFTSEYYQYKTPNGATLSPIESVRDLGVLISSDLSWGPHINNMTDSARKISSWILSVFQSRDETTMMTLYKSLVRSRLEYCSPLWTSNKVEDIMKIEAIQRHFTSKIDGYKDLHYWDRIAGLKLMSLQRRRERYCILHIFKIIHKLVPNDLNITFNTSDRRGICANIPPMAKASKPKFQSLYDSSFAVFAPRLWNTLPKSIREEETFTKFKRALTNHILSTPDEPPITGAPSSNSLLQRAGQLGRQQMSRR